MTSNKENEIILEDEQCDNYIVGGKLGDLIHTMYVIMVINSVKKKKANLYITDNTIYGGDKFATSAETVYNELKSIILQQPYINNVYILDDSKPIPYSMNLNAWRCYQIVYTTDWLYFLTSIYNIPLLPKQWITLTNQNNMFADKILIHRSVIRNLPTFPWMDIVTKNKCIFITCNLDEYNNFQYKEHVELYKCLDLTSLFNAINGSKFFIGNQSSPLAMAYSLFKPMLCELYPEAASFYKHLNKYNENAFWIADDSSHLINIEKYINL